MKNRPFRSTFANMGGGTNHNPKRGRSFLFEHFEIRWKALFFGFAGKFVAGSTVLAFVVAES